MKQNLLIAPAGSLNSRARSGAGKIQKYNREGAKSAKEDAKNTKEMLGFLFFLRVLLRVLRAFAVALILAGERRIAHGNLGIERRSTSLAQRSPAFRPGLLKISAILAMASAAALAQTAPNSLTEQATMSAAKQSRVREETAKATADLSRIIDEFDRNGLGDEQDAKTLRAVRDTLIHLTDSQMQQVLSLLDQARNAHSDDAAKTNSASAFAEQKDIYVAMQKTLLAFQQQADLLELSLQFSELAKRQNANFKSAKHLALRTMNSRDLDEGRQAELHVQQTEQDAIQEEVSARLEKLASLMKAVDPAVAAQLATVTQQVAPAALKQALSASSSELRLTHLTKAASEELSSYKQLREFSRLAKPPREPEQVLTDAADQMGITIAAYQVAMTDTVYAAHNNTDENRMNIDDEQGDLVDDVGDVSKDIQTLAAAAFSILGDAKDMMQEARAASLGGTDRQRHVLPMLIQARQEILDELKRRQLMAQLQDGSTKLERAEVLRDEVKQLADKQKQIMDETRKAHSDEQVAAMAAKQAAVTDALKALSPAAAKELPDVAQAVDKAAATSSQANDRLADNKPREAADPQQQTLDALTNAQKQADATAADLEKKTQELQQLQQTHDDIAKVANKEQALAVQTAVAAAEKQPPPTNPTSADAQPAANNPTKPDAPTPAQANADAKPPAGAKPAADNPPTASAQKNTPGDAAKPVAKDPADANVQDAAKPEAAKPDAAKSDPPKPDAAKSDAAKPDLAAQADPLKTDAPTPQQLAKDQLDVAQQTQDLQAATPPDAADAAEPLKDATQQMNAAAKQLDKNAPAPAQQPEQGAIAALQKAQAAVDQKMDQLKKELGQQPDPAADQQALDAAGQEVQQALQNTNDAQAAMKQNQPNQAGQEMQGAAQHAASAQEQGALPQAAQQDLAQAHQELAQGAAAEAGGNEKGAGEHAGKAAGLLQQAMQQIQQAEGQGEQGRGKDPKSGKKGDQWKPGQMAGGDPPKNVQASHVDSSGNRGNAAGSSNYNGLPDRDRAAVTQSGSEPAPAQYQSMVQQYMRNLADDSEAPAAKK